MLLPLILVFIIIIVSIIYVVIDKKHIYIKNIEINFFKIFNIKIQNKEKCFGTTVNHPKHFKKH